MESENTEQITADQEVPQPKKMSAKECVQQRLAGLASGAIQPVKRGPGRPRGPNYGKGYQSTMDPSNPRSVKAAEAGRKGQQSIQSKLQTEASRKKWGRIRQAELDQQVATLDQEMQTYTWSAGLDQRDTKEFVEICVSILNDFIWQRSYPMEADNFWDEFEAPIEEKKYTRGWPDWYMRDLLIMAKYVMASDRPGVRKLATEAATQFLEWAKNQNNKDSAFEQTIEQTKKMLPKLQDGSIFKGFILPEDDPRLTPPEPVRSIEEQLQQIQNLRRPWEHQGRDVSSLPRIESEAERRLREDAEREAAVLAQKEEAVARIIEEQQRQQRELLGGSYQQIQHYLQSGNVFGSQPHRK